MKWQQMAPGLFDMISVVMLMIGLARGKSRGMSQELLDVLRWLATVVVSALLYKSLGQFVADYTHISLLFGYVWAYVGVAVLIHILFGSIKSAVGEKLVGSDVFGKLEFLLGMWAGALRFACMLICAVALLNAKYISPQELAATQKAQQEALGSISVPTIGSMQVMVFKESVVGPFILKHLSAQLITPTSYDGNLKKRDGWGKKMERAVDETLDSSTSGGAKKH